MLYTVYTDGAGNDVANVAGCSYCILTDKDFIQSGCTRLVDMCNPTHAETIAVGLALNSLLSAVDITDKDTIHINTDCLAVVDFCNSYADNNDSIRSNIPAVRSTIKVVREVNKLCTLKFRKVKAHKNFLNPNTYVDRLAKLSIWR